MALERNRRPLRTIWWSVDILAFGVLLFAPFFAPIVALGALVALVLRIKCRDHTVRWRVLYVRSWWLLAILAGMSALGAYALGAMSGFYILDPDQACAAMGIAGDRIVTRLTLPVSAQCVTDEGVGTELVPGFINPVVYAGLLILLVALGTGLGRFAVRARALARKFLTQ